jgi:hypothetical protein
MRLDLRCLAKTCGKTFTASSVDARCPSCRGKRTRWVPGGFGISKASKAIDKATRDLAADFKLTDIRTPERGLPAIRPTATKTQSIDLGGMRAEVPILPGGMPGAFCTSGSGDAVKDMMRVLPQGVAPPKRELPAPSVNTRIVAEPYRPKDWLK